MTTRFQAKPLYLSAIGVLIAAIVAISVASVLMLREREMETWRRQIANLSMSMEEQISQAMSSAAIVMESIAERIDAMGIRNAIELRSRTKTEAMHQIMRDKVTGLTQVEMAAIVAANGDVINFTRSFPPPAINVSDRDYFLAQRETSAPGWFVSSPVKNEGSGKWFFYLSRRLNDSNGRFMGLVLIGLSVDRFVDFYERLGKSLGDGAAITLYRRDFTVLARWPRNDETAGKRNLGGTTYRVVEELKETEDVIYASGPRMLESGGSVGRLGAVRVLDRFPMILNLTITEEFILSNWRHTAKWIASVAAGSIAALAIVMIVLLRIARQREQTATLLSNLADQVPGTLFQYRLSPDGRASFPYVNQFGLAMHDLKAEALPVDAAKLLGYIHPEDNERVHASIQDSARNLQSWSEDYRLLLPDGRVVWRHGSSRPQKLKDGVVLWHGYIADITERKQAEEALRQSEERLSRAELASKSGNWTLHLETQVMVASKGAAQIYGAMEGRHAFSVVQKAPLPEYRPLLDAAMKDLIENGVPYDVIFKIRTADIGEIKDIHSVAVYDQEKRMVFGVIQDITEQLRMQRAFEQEESRRRIFFEQSQDGIALLRQDGSLAEWNPAFARMLGYSEEELGRIDVKDWNIKLSNEEIETVTRHLGLGYLNIETQHRRKDGTIYDVEVSINGVEWLGQQYLFCLYRDITARKQAEEAQRLAVTVFSHAREGILITDAEGTILDVNAMFSQLTGFSREEVVGNKPRLLSSGRHDKAFYAAMWRELIEKGHWIGEVWNRRKDGEVYPEMLTISAVRDAQGKTQQYVALFSDITELKDHEQQLDYMAHYDVLTKLPNRLLLADRLQQAMSQVVRRRQNVAICYLDLDGFKAVNDRYGHDVGDQLLIALSSRMKQALRESDTLARIGGDEFVAILIDLDDENFALTTIGRLIHTASQPVQLGEFVVRVSASLGVTFYPQEEAVDADQLLRQADRAMYEAKLAGKNRYCVFGDVLMPKPER